MVALILGGDRRRRCLAGGRIHQAPGQLHHARHHRDAQSFDHGVLTEEGCAAVAPLDRDHRNDPCACGR